MTLLRVTNLHKTYRLGRVDVPVLRGIDLAVNKGEFLAILGASGSGKSTLLHLIGGLDRPDRSPAASIEFDGRSVTTLGPGALDEYRNRSVGFVFQFYHLLPELNVVENVLLAAMVGRGRFAYLRRSSELRRSAGALLGRVGLSHRLSHRPLELSGGERQRVAIARALINQPALLLADEPTGNLDRATGGKVLEQFLEIRRDQGQTLIVVTHDEETARRADRIVRLVDGRVMAS